MKININLNELAYRYEIYQIVNIFYPFSEINFNTSDSCDLSIDVNVSDDLAIIWDGLNKDEFNLKSEFTKKEVIKNHLYLFLSLKTGKSFPWGTLIGIRPSKIALALMNEGKDYNEIIKYYEKRYLASKEKAELCIKIAKREKDIVNKSSRNISVYIGMPFCPTRCLYCSFASNPIKGCSKLVDPYLQALTYEIERISEFINKKRLVIENVYFGGGTPTSVSNDQFEQIMKDIYNKFIYKNNIKEFTVECGRPDSISFEKLDTMRRYKATRISINPQTMNDETLKLIGRNHNSQDVVEKFNLARSMGFDNINMDLIVGLPGERLVHMKKTCSEILKLKPDSLTVHGMSVKKGSKLLDNLKQNLNLVDLDELIGMHDETVKLAEALEMEPYYMYRQKNMLGNMENVGYSLPDKESPYNIQMIEERQTIIAMGADAITKIVFLEENRIERAPNLKDVREYNNRIEELIEKKITMLEELY